MRYQLKQIRRSGFTLIELIVVISIIVIIASLTLGAITKSFSWVKQKNTEQTMTKVAQRLQRVIDRLYKEADDWPSSTENFILGQAGGSFERARILKVLYLYKWNFPNSYAEAFHNVQESRQLYDNTGPTFPGYPQAVAILRKLRTNDISIPDPFALAFAPWPTVAYGAEVYSPQVSLTPAANQMSKVLPEQSSACMLAAFISANGSSDDFSSEEVLVDTAGTDRNPRLLDAWGTPLLFLRHGNFICSRHRFGGGGVDRSAWSMGMVSNVGNSLDFAPLEYVLNPAANLPPSNLASTRFYFDQIQNRSKSAFRSLLGTDPFDTTGLIRTNPSWRSQSSPNQYWLNPVRAAWQAPLGAGTQHGLYFRATFGYSPELADQVINLPPTITFSSQGYCPMLILSAGGDKLFNQWDDNLDSYRLQINVSGQQ